MGGVHYRGGGGKCMVRDMFCQECMVTVGLTSNLNVESFLVLFSCLGDSNKESDQLKGICCDVACSTKLSRDYSMWRETAHLQTTISQIQLEHHCFVCN